jgi:hypothetical protein
LKPDVDQAEGGDQQQRKDEAASVNKPSPRFGSGLAFTKGTLYLFGGLFEQGDVTFTLKDFYSLGN